MYACFHVNFHLLSSCSNKVQIIIKQMSLRQLERQLETLWKSEAVLSCPIAERERKSRTNDPMSEDKNEDKEWMILWMKSEDKNAPRGLREAHCRRSLLLSFIRGRLFHLTGHSVTHNSISQGTSCIVPWWGVVVRRRESERLGCKKCCSPLLYYIGSQMLGHS